MISINSFLQGLERESGVSTTHTSSLNYTMLAPNSRIDEVGVSELIQLHGNKISFVLQDTSIQEITDNEIDLNRTIGGNSTEDARQQQLLNYVANRVSVHRKFD